MILSLPATDAAFQRLIAALDAEVREPWSRDGIHRPSTGWPCGSHW